MIKDYLGAMFEPTLLFGICASLIGISAALYYSHLNLQLAVLVVMGVVFAQMAVNMVDDYTDFKRGIDSETVKTKFSGGSNVLTDGKMRPKELLGLGVAAAIAAGAIGAFLLGSAPAILPIIAIGGISIFLYAAFLVRIPFLAEPLTALNFALIPLGSYIVAYGSTA
ncbi:MAG: prenyltransferase, partial [Candidatus Micrarchaeota archaeon]|nr:prenyltransferase [Candidatus Micrarchaeota archaeon]